jgi:hypothetical protein
MSDQTTFKRRASVLAIALAVGALMIAASAQAEDVPDRLKKQIRIMEKVLNEVLEESPNLLVHSTTPTHGIYLGGFGALFTFEASLVDGFGWQSWNLGKRFDFSNLFGNIQIERDGGRIIIHTPEGEEEEVLVEVEDDEGNVDHKTIEDMRAESRESEQQRYEDGKGEIIDTLIDYGETLTGLDNKEFIGVAVYLGKDTLFQKREISRLVIQIKMSDLRAHADGTLSRDRLRERVLVQEY